jgi:hypothetical protein
MNIWAEGKKCPEPVRPGAEKSSIVKTPDSGGERDDNVM